jgi:serine/threonine protein kinase
MEIAHGTLKGLLDMARRRGVPRLDIDLSRFFFQQIILTVKYCHDKGIIIRDLKPANLLVTWGPNGPSRLQLCDFGWAKIIPDLVRSFSHSFIQPFPALALFLCVPVLQRSTSFCAGREPLRRLLKQLRTSQSNLP